ncbi:hypothetical protein J4457_04315 [Candidatus Woesearchaeota archaeon]|nr:hypothetical protein [Candidatus Woesearchaeota archaeon]
MTEGKASPWTIVLNVAKEIFTSLFSFNTLFQNIKDQLNEVLDRCIKKLASSLLMVAGTICITLGIIFFMMEYLKVTKTIAFLIGGAILLLVSFGIKYNLGKEDQ